MLYGIFIRPQNRHNWELYAMYENTDIARRNYRDLVLDIGSDSSIKLSRLESEFFKEFEVISYHEKREKA